MCNNALHLFTYHVELFTQMEHQSDYCAKNDRQHHSWQVFHENDGVDSHSHGADAKNLIHLPDEIPR